MIAKPARPAAEDKREEDRDAPHPLGYRGELQPLERKPQTSIEPQRGHEEIGGIEMPAEPSSVHNSPPAGCQPKYSDSAVFSTSSHAAEATLQFARITMGRPNNVQVRNNS